MPARKATSSTTTTAAPGPTTITAAPTIDDEPYDMDDPSEVPTQTILSVFKLASWILENYSTAGKRPEPKSAEVYYLSDKVQRFSYESVFADYENKQSGETIYFAPLAIRLRDQAKQSQDMIYRSDLLRAHGEKCGVSYSVNTRLRKLDPRTKINVLLIDLTCKSFSKDGSVVQYYDSRNFAAKSSDQLAIKLSEKYAASEPIFDRIRLAQTTEIVKADKKLIADFADDKL
jgi:hypothetical protein